jgi:hypothetical protein
MLLEPMKRPSAKKWFATALAASALSGIATKAILSHRAGRGATTEMPQQAFMVLPSIQARQQFPIMNPMALYAIKADGSTWKTTPDMHSKSIRFLPPTEEAAMRGARAWGSLVLILSNGDAVAPQVQGKPSHLPGAAFSADMAKAAGLPELQNQKLVRMPDFDVHLYSGGTFLQKNVPLGVGLKTGRFRGFYVQQNVVQYEAGGKGVAIVRLSDGTVLASGAGYSTKTAGECIPLGPAVSVTVTSHYGVAALADGSVWAWRNDRDHTPRPVAGLGNIVQVNVGLFAEDGIFALDNSGQLWKATIGQAKVKPQKATSLSNVTYFDVGIFVLALKKDGTVWAFIPNRDDVAVQVFDHVKQSERLAVTLPTSSPCLNRPAQLPPEPKKPVIERDFWTAVGVAALIFAGFALAFFLMGGEELAVAEVLEGGLLETEEASALGTSRGIASASKSPKTFRTDIEIPTGRSGQKIPLDSVPNSYVRGAGDHVFETDETGRIIRDISPQRVKNYGFNTAPDGSVYRKPVPHPHPPPSPTDIDILRSMGILK